MTHIPNQSIELFPTFKLSPLLSSSLLNVQVTRDLQATFRHLPPGPCQVLYQQYTLNTPTQILHPLPAAHLTARTLRARPISLLLIIP